MKLLKIIFILLCTLLSYPFLAKSERQMILADLKRWAQFKEEQVSLPFFLRLFADHKEYRSVVYYRLRRRFRLLPSLLLKGESACYISAKQAGGGLLLIHGFSTIINCRRLGENCTFFQQVTIGYSKGSTPVIGTNCVICCGAIIIGDVKIGNNVIVGAGSVVTRDVPDNSIVTGNPCTIRSAEFDGDILDYV